MQSCKLALCLPSFFLLQLWPDTSQIKALKVLLNRFLASYLLILSSSFSREALIAYPFSFPWTPPSFSVELALSAQCSRFDPSLFRHDTGIAHLDSLPNHDIVIWTDGYVPHSFGKRCLGVLANYSICGAKTTISCLAGPVCSIFFSEICIIMHALIWCWQDKQFCHFFSFIFLLDFHYPCYIFSLRFSFFLLLPKTSGRNYSFSASLFSKKLRGVFGHSFFVGNDTPDELAKRGALLQPSAVPWILSHLSYSVISFVGIEAYHLFKIFRPTIHISIC